MTKSRMPLALILLIALTASLVAVPAVAEVTRSESASFALPDDGRVSLSNINGDVSIEAWDAAEVTVDYTVRGRSAESLEEVEVEIDARDNRISIETRYPDSHGRGNHRDPASVDYTLRVPRGARLADLELVNGSLTISGVAGGVEASLVNGDVEASQLSGDLELSSVNGTVEASFDELDGPRSIEISSVNGSVELTLPRGADARIDASTVHGKIRNDFGFEEEVSEFVGRSLAGTLGAGSASVEVSNVNGTIDLKSW